jgi:hypothetical protein
MTPVANGNDAPAAARPVQRKLRASITQEQLFPLVSRFDAGRRAYIVVSAYRLRGRIDVAGLRQSVDFTVARHEALRTGLSWEDECLMQVITARRSGVLEFVDLSRGGPHAAEKDIEREVRAMAERRLAWDGEPLTHFRLFRLAELDHVMVAVSHHLIVDGWSIGVLWREIADRYRGTPASSEDSALVQQFADFAQQQRAWLSTDRARQMMRYWSDELLAGPVSTTFPYDTVAIADAGNRSGASRRLTLDARLTERLVNAARSRHATLPALTLMAFQVLLHARSGMADVVVGVPLANRPRRSFYDAIGFYVHTHAVRVRVDRGEGLGELLDRANAKLAAAVTNQELPLAVVLDALKSDGGLWRSRSVYRVLFNFHNEASAPPDFGPVEVEPYGVATETRRKADITLHLTNHGHELECEFEYDTRLYEASTIDRIAEDYIAVLSRSATEPDARIRSVLG